MKALTTLLFLVFWHCGIAENTTNLTGPKPSILYFHVNTDIRLRYARTVIDTKVSNSANVSQEVSFNAILPENAFISEFKIIVDDHEYNAYVKEKEAARREYEEAVSQGRTAAHVAMNARDSHRFTVSLNVEPEKKVSFILTYEELLSRKLGVYRHVLNLDPGEILQDFSVTVRIKEFTNINKLNVPALLTSNEISDSPDSNPLATIERPSSHIAVVKFSPTPEQQRELASEGVKGQFVVEYDVDRSEDTNEVLMEDGYFVHFFAPEDLPPLRKHVSFVLDVSGSMSGRKIEQLKQAMTTILEELNANDTFSIAIFSSSVQVWNHNLTEALMIERIGRLSGMRWGDYGEEEEEVENENRYVIASATPENISSAKNFIRLLPTIGATNINDAVLKGLELSKLAVARHTVHVQEENNSHENKPQPILIFLTDGKANVGVQNLNQIVKNVGVANTGNCSIFALGLGKDVDFDFLKKLSLRNFGFARKIYEASDTALQLRNFYRFVASPLLSQVTFKYQAEQVFTNTLTKVKYHTVFSGSEIVVAGKVAQDNFTVEIEGLSQTGTSKYTLVPAVPSGTNNTVGYMERLWAYLTIRQLLDKKEADVSSSDDEEGGDDHDDEDFIANNQTILELALKYSFVTPVTSLVVVKPNETSAVDTVDASEDGGSSHGGGIVRTAMHPRADAVDGPRISHSSQTVLADINEVTWIAEVTHNGTVTLHTGANGTTEEFQIARADQANVPHEACTSPTTQSGHCRHFRYCILNVFVSSEQSFLPYHCRIENYLGVCCPDHLHPAATR